MTDSFKIEWEGSVERWIDDLLPKMAEAQKLGLLKAAKMATGEVQRAIFEDFPSGRGGLAKSYTATLLQPKDGKLRAGAISDLVYARIQDEGGPIVAKNAKALTIPISEKAKKLSSRGVSAREFPGGLDLVWPRGSQVGYLVKSIKKRTELHYLLKRRTHLDGTGYLDKAANNAEPEIVEIMEAALAKAGNDAEAGGE